MMVVTAQQFKISESMCSRFKPQAFAALLVDEMMVVTAPLSKISESMYSRFRPRCGLNLLHLSRFWQIKWWLNCSAVQDQRKHVQQIQTTGICCAFGRWNDGSDSSAVQDQRKHVQQIQTTLWFESAGFATIMADEAVVARGYQEYGNDRSAVQLPISCHSLAAHMADLSKRWLQPCQVVRVSPCTCGEVKTSTDYLINLWTLKPAQTLEKTHEKNMSKPKKFGWRRKVKIIGTFQVPSIFRYVWDSKYLMYTFGFHDFPDVMHVLRSGWSLFWLSLSVQGLRIFAGLLLLLEGWSFKALS